MPTWSCYEGSGQLFASVQTVPTARSAWCRTGLAPGQKGGLSVWATRFKFTRLGRASLNDLKNCGRRYHATEVASWDVVGGM
jgi:hypothetical protein